MNRLRLLLSGFVVTLVCASSLTPIFAASSPTNGLSVSPAINNLQAQPGQNSLTFNESVTNVTVNKLAVNLSIKDFGALNANGSVGFYGTNYKSATNPHSLASAIALPGTEYIIDAHQTLTIPINITNINQLSPGGHYSAILFTPFSAVSGAKGNQINLQASVASLIFLATSSGGVQSLKLTGLSMASFGFTFPSNVYALLTNNGNTQTIPRGTISFYGPTNNLISQAVINSNSGLILPNTARLFSENLSVAHDLFRLPGVYKMQIRYSVDGSTSYQTATKNFVYINPLIFIVIILIILIIKLISYRRKARKSNPKQKKWFRKSKD